MSTEQMHSQVALFYGEQPAHAHERRAINQVRDQLGRRGIPATLLVNFTVARGARQVDLVIITAQRFLNVELKLVDPSLPMVGPTNGFWSQRLPDGTDRTRERNFYDQAMQQTYGLADILSALHRDGAVPGPRSDKFPKDIETLVCLDPYVPDGSTLQPHAYVKALGLDNLLDRVSRPGKGLPHWTFEDWATVIRHLGLYREGDDTPAALRRVAATAALEEYRHHFSAFIAAGIDPLIPMAAGEDQPTPLGADELSQQLNTQGQRVLLLGASGQGKTHLSRHTALALTKAGGIVIWLAGDDYDKDRLARSLSRAVGPFTTEKPHSLLAAATELGTSITLIIDALETCAHREELLKQIRALQRQYPAAVLVSTAAGPEPQLMATRQIQLATPTAEERAELAQAYGAGEEVAQSAEFVTRLDLSLAAQLHNDLPAGATTTDVLDTFVSRRARSETVRAGLRALARAMDVGVRSALPAGEAALILRRCQDMSAAIDQTLDCPLVHIHQGLLRFSHERFARFLAAEDLVMAAPNGVALARLLDEPAHEDLRRYALLLEADPERRYEAIRELADDELLANAVCGEFGPETAKHARADITELLIAAAASVSEATFTASEPPEDFMHGQWSLPRPWTPTEFAALSAAGRCAHQGIFSREVGALMDATDPVLRKTMRELHAAGSNRAISTVIAAAFGPNGRHDSLAASVVATAAEHHRSFGAKQAAPEPVAAPMWWPNSRCYGRLYLAAVLSRSIVHPDDAQHLPDLVQTGLDAGGYHLRLKLLYAAQFACRVLDPDSRARMIDVLNGYDNDPADWGTSSTLIEVLASYDQITPMNDLAGITAAITEVLADPDDVDHRHVAQGMVAAQFEDERILGPYSEAIDNLPTQQRLTLFAMSVLAPGLGSISNPYALRHIADGASGTEGIIAQALAHFAGVVPDDTLARQEAVASHLHGLHGWARVSDTLPPSTTPRGEPFAIAWRMVDELVLRLLRGDSNDAAAQAIWHQLRLDFPGYAATILCDMHHAEMSLFTYHDPDGDKFNPHRTIVDTYPDHVRAIAEWALTHREELTRPTWTHSIWAIGPYALRVLGAVGTADTADLLRHHYIHDKNLGRNAIEALKAIDTRLNPH
jgi:hypothetical protein